jgi:hypothetical protein
MSKKSPPVIANFFKDFSAALTKTFDYRGKKISNLSKKFFIIAFSYERVCYRYTNVTRKTLLFKGNEVADTRIYERNGTM